MVCCSLFTWSYWALTIIVSCIYSSLTLSSIGIKLNCVKDLTKCIDDDIKNNVIKTGAIVSSFVTMLQSFIILFSLINDRKRFQGYCIGSAFHITIIMLWYAVTINTSSQKIEHWTASSIEHLFKSSYYLACILSGMHIFWVFVMLNIVTNNRNINTCCV